MHQPKPNMETTLHQLKQFKQNLGSVNLRFSQSWIFLLKATNKMYLANLYKYSL